MPARRAFAIAASLLPLAGCSLLTSFDGLTGGGAPAADGSVSETPLPEGGADAPASIGPTDARAEGDATPAKIPFAYRRRVSVTNGAADPLPVGYTIRVRMIDFKAAVTAGKIRGDAADLRLFAGAPPIERDRVVDLSPPNDVDTLWFTLDAPLAAGATAADNWIYYGAPNETTPKADGSAVFALYEAFDGPTLSGLWAKNGSPVLAGGTLTLRQGQQDGIASIAAADNVPAFSVFETLLRITTTTSGATGTPYLFGYRGSGDFPVTAIGHVWTSRSVGNTIAVDDFGTNSSLASAELPQTAASRWYRVERSSVETDWYVDGVKRLMGDPDPVDRSFFFQSSLSTADVIIHLVRGRALVAPEPSVQLGAEETLP